MTKNITYRSFKAKDIRPLAKIIQETWFSGPSEREWMPYHQSLLYLYHCLSQHEWSQVALLDGKAVGLILGRKKEAPVVHQFYRLSEWLLAAHLFFYQEGRESLRDSMEEAKINKNLLKQTNESFDSELVLFIVGKEARGTGIGSTLFQDYLDYKDSTGAKSFYLYTDDACTYQFYERKGLERVGTHPEGEFNYYIYKGTA